MSARRKKVTVSFAGDDDAHGHIANTCDNKRKLPRRRIVKSGSNVESSFAEDLSDSTDIQEADCDDDMQDEEEKFKPITGVDLGYHGEDVFAFPSIKRRSQMTAKASLSAKSASTPKTPKSVNSQSKTPASEKTPRSILKASKRGEAVDRLRKNPRLAATTPLRLYSRNKQTGDSDSEESLSSDDSDDTESDSSSLGSIRKSTPKSTPKSRISKGSTPKSSAKQGEGGTPKSSGRTSRGQENTPVSVEGRRSKIKSNDEAVKKENVDEYFHAQTMETVTSDRTLSRLETPRMDRETLDTVLAGLEAGYTQERAGLMESYREKFSKWMYLLCSGFNLLFHGVGSKRGLLEEFRETMVSDFTHIVVNGFFPSLTIKSILNNITEDVLDHQGSFRNPLEQCHYICQQYQLKDADTLFLIVHNIDGPMLRQERAQSILSLLAQSPNIHVLASIDHINAPLLWDHSKTCGFHWLWLDVTTYEDYTEETCYENSLMVQQSGALALSSLTHVSQSLTPNSRGIFMLLATHHMEHCNEAGYQGLAFPQLYQKCREAFLVNTDQTLRTHLTEFKDHKLIAIKKASDGVECLTIPLDPGILKEFMDQQEQKG